MVEDRQLLVEAVADGAPADHRQLRVDVHRAGARHEEEARLEVLQVVDRERVHPLAVDRQHPLRQEPRVEREEAGRDRSARPRCPRASSLTTNVLPSRILTRPSLISPAPRRTREEPLNQDEQPWIALHDHLAAEPRRHEIQLARDRSVEPRPVRRAPRSLRPCSAAIRRCPLVDRQQPARGSPAVDDVETRAALRLPEQRLIPATTELGEELRRRRQRSPRASLCADPRAWPVPQRFSFLRRISARGSQVPGTAPAPARTPTSSTAANLPSMSSTSDSLRVGRACPARPGRSFRY